MGQRFFLDSEHVQACSIIAKLDRDVVALVAQIDRDCSGSRLSSGRPHVGFFNTVGNAITQQMFESWRHAVKHAPVHFNRTTGDIQLDLLARFFGRLTHHRVQSLGNAFKFHHARTQQIALQLARLAALSDQVVLSAFHGPLKIALHRGHVVHRLGHHAGEFLHPRKAIELQRVETGSRIFRKCQSRLHLRFGLNLDVPQLLPQAIQVARKIRQRTAELAQAHIQARTADHHLASLVDQTIEQLSTYADRLAGRNAQRSHLQRTRKTDSRRNRSGNRRSRHRRGRRHQGGDRLCVNTLRVIGHRNHGVGIRRTLHQSTQAFHIGLQAIETGLQRLDLVGGYGLGIQ